MGTRNLRTAWGTATIAAMAAGLIVALPLALGAKAKIKTTSVSTGTITTAIPDADLNPEPNTADHLVRAPVTLGIPAKGKITDVNVGLRISETAAIGSMRDLELSLATPAGVINLSSDNGGTSDDFGSGAKGCDGELLVFDSQATDPITSQNPLTDAPVSGTFAPEEPLQAVNGLAGSRANGPWTLLAHDDDPGAAQSLHCFKLDVTYSVKKKKKKKKK
jgi:subtilisin-like proprotein convertase family protein